MSEDDADLGEAGWFEFIAQKKETHGTRDGETSSREGTVLGDRSESVLAR